MTIRALALLVLAVPFARADFPPGWPISGDCAVIQPDSILIQAWTGGCGDGGSFQIICLQEGTLHFDLHTITLASTQFAGYQLQRFDPDESGFDIVQQGSFPTQPGEQVVHDVAIPLQANSVLKGVFFTEFQSPLAGLQLLIDNVSFVPTTGFFDIHTHLDASDLRVAKAGQPLVLLPDVDGDGLADLAFNDDSAQFSPEHLVRVVSGLSGALIAEFPGQAGDPGAQWLEDVGDLDGDGRDDLAAGDASFGGAGHVLLRSAATGAVLAELPAHAAGSQFGASVAGPGDVDLDGTPDVLVGAPADSTAGAGEGMAYLVSGANGSTLLAVQAPVLSASSAWGRRVWRAGDVNADGRPDLVIGNTQTFTNIFVCDGVTGAVLLQTSSQNTGLHCVAAGADLDADGHADLLIGSQGGSGMLHALSGADGHVIWSLDDPWPVITGLGASAAIVGDEDGDGVRDVLAGVPEILGEAGGAHLLSGATGALIYAVEARPDWLHGHFGADIVGGQDVDGDGALDAVMFAPKVGLGFGDMLEVMSGAAAEHVVPVLAGSGELAAGSVAHLELTHGLPGGMAVLVVGAQAYFWPTKGGFLVASPDVLVPLVLDATGSAHLDAHLSLDLPSAAEFWLQSWHPDPGGLHGFKASNGLRALTP